jgi:hypothetical protein
VDGPGRVEKEDQPAKSVFPEFEIVIEEEVGTPSTLEERVRYVEGGLVWLWGWGLVVEVL